MVFQDYYLGKIIKDNCIDRPRFRRVEKNNVKSTLQTKSECENIWEFFSSALFVMSISKNLRVLQQYLNVVLSNIFFYHGLHLYNLQ